MNRVLLCALVVLSFRALAQNSPQPNSTGANVVVAKFSVPRYPILARNARVSGAVKLDVTVRANGSVESVALVSGHPLLAKAALDSAQQTEFECKGCATTLTHYLMTYRFELGDTIYCTGIDAAGNAQFEDHPVQVTRSRDTVTIVDHPVGTCDPTTSITFVKVRSVKSLFLWRCSKRYPL